MMVMQDWHKQDREFGQLEHSFGFEPLETMTFPHSHSPTTSAAGGRDPALFPAEVIGGSDIPAPVINNSTS